MTPTITIRSKNDGYVARFHHVPLERGGTNN